MPKSSNQKFKFTYLMKIMLEKTDDEHALTLSQIIAELEKYSVTAERKSIYSDFHEMTDRFGIEVIKEQIGRETYYHVGAREFELAEVKLLIDAIQCAKFITERKSRELIKKVKGFVSEHQASQLQRQVFVNGRIKTMNESIYYSVDEIYNAIEHNKKIRFKYFSWQPDKSQYILNNGNFFTVSPWALTWCDEYYYMVAFDDYSRQCKHYRVDKMLKPQVIDEMREGAEQFRNLDMAAYSKATFGMYGGEKKRVKIHLHNKMAGVFIDRFGKDITLRPIDEKHCELNVEVFISPQFYGWIFGLGKDVKIVGPDEVVTQMKEHLRTLTEIME
ncbi:helix-turn-helix transcriptional regulator [Butyrivibrio sp. INlla14]|uniref:helix-turn-helix transcriptional regulator n=1 Tax=Butyrivibrio sp. INlla14 TaxID=1520808 RepID=UPI0008770F84|nr:WYL domain-containing protein [Butyrivibrio sp. INlla14]SCY09689.1 WYL domain-containing protein [Butyrivibrio sp. INlla14]